MKSGYRHFCTLLIVSFVLTGCAARLVKYQPYAQYINHPAALKEDVLVCPIKDNLSPSAMTLQRRPAGQRLMLKSGDFMLHYTDEFCSRPVETLKAGTALTLQDAYSYFNGGGYTIAVYGVYTADGARIPFVFQWPMEEQTAHSWHGDYPMTYVLRDPWEDTSVPERRFVGFKGKEYKE